MAELMLPRVDFSTLGDLPQVYREARDRENARMSLASLGQAIQSGNIDYSQAAGQALQSGNASLGLSLLNLAEQQKKLAREQAASEQFTRGITGGEPAAVPSAPTSVAPQTGTAPRGLRNNNPLNLEASPFTQQQPGFVGSDGRFGRFESPDAGMAAADKLLANYGAKGINTVAGVIGRWAPQNDGNNVSAYAQFVARKAGIDPNAPINLADPAVRARILPAMAEFENGRPVQVAALGSGVPTPDTAPTSPAGPQVAQASPAAPQVPQQPGQITLSPRARQLIGAMANPALPSAQKEVAKTLLAQELDAAKMPEPVKKYLFAVGQGFKGDIVEFETQLRKAGATTVNVDQKGEGKFEEEFGKKQADRWSKYIDNADAAERRMVDINTMREIHNRAGAQGAMVGVKEAIGPYAEAFGINIEGLSDIQAYSQVIQRLAPQQRAPGSGSTSDIEFKGFLKSLPGLNQNPAAREVGLNTMEALARDEMARGAIASRLATKEINRAQAEKELRALPDPMKGFTEWRRANPELYGQALKTAPAASSAPSPQQKAIPQGAPAGTKLAPDGFHYAPDPARPGKWLKVE